MIIYLLKWLENVGWHIPAAFSNSSTRMILAALFSLLFTLFIGPFFIRKLTELKMGQPIRKSEAPKLGELHAKKENTPTMGGILIIASALCSLLLFMNIKSHYTWILGISTVWLGLIGGYDDFLKLRYKNSKGLSGKKKFCAQFLLALGIGIVLFWGESSVAYFFPFIKTPFYLFSAVALLITIFVIIGGSNSVNLTDGLDGLASGLLVLVFLVFALFAFLCNNHKIADYLNILYMEGSGEIAVYLSALFGACLGFIWFNGHPAQVFMGDTGSLTLGGIMGISAVLLRREFLLAIVGGIFVAEALSVILQVGFYKRTKKRFFLCATLHHHFEYKGWPETKVVLRFWIIGLILAMLGIASLKFQ